ncbi:MAG: hypothetical protein AB7F74_05240 [Parvibaculaceae bacterium]
MIDFSQLDKIFERIASSMNFLEESEKRAVVRSLRTMYFYPDELLKYLNELINTQAANPESSIAGGARFASTEGDMDEAIRFITSKSVATNLKLSVEMVDELRHLADFKSGVRGLLHAIFVTWMFERDRAKVLEQAIEARNDIAYLNGRIRDLEAAIMCPTSRES